MVGVGIAGAVLLRRLVLLVSATVLSLVYQCLISILIYVLPIVLIFVLVLLRLTSFFINHAERRFQCGNSVVDAGFSMTGNEIPMWKH